MKKVTKILLIAAVIMIGGLALTVGNIASSDASRNNTKKLAAHKNVRKSAVLADKKKGVTTISGDEVSDQTPTDGTIAPATPTGSAVTPLKSGLVREKRALYFYRYGEPVRKTLIKTHGRIYYFGWDGKAVTNCWRTVGEYRYYFKKRGRAATGSIKINKKYRIFNKYGHLVTSQNRRVIRIKKRRFLALKNGVAAHGWYRYKGRMLHVRKNGSFDRRKKCGYIPLNGKGFAKNATQVQAMLLARKFIHKHTSKSDSPMRKFEKCFRQIIGGNTYIGDWRPEGFGEKGWQYRSAVEMFTFGLMGDCYGISCAVAAVAKDLGFQPYVIWAAHSHAFVYMDGRYYDNMHGAHFGTTTHEPFVIKEKFKF